MLAVLIALAVGQCDPNGPIYSCPSTQSSALFEFAPAGGAGMTAVCAGTTPTGAKGETLTFTRASSGTCLKNAFTTNIANGDMVTLTSNQPRVMTGGVGAAGLLVEGARTNLILRSEELDNAAWSLLGVVSGSGNATLAPTVTADQAVAPDGNTVGDLVSFKAVTGGGNNASAIYQSVTTTSTWACGIFAKGASASGSVQIGLYDNGASVYRCATCSYTTTGWTRCTKENIANSGANATFIIGNLDNYCGDGTQAAKDVYLTMGQCEVGAVLSSYIKTTGATATRAVESASVAAPSFSGATVSWSATLVPATTLPSTTTWVISRPTFDASNSFTSLTFSATTTRHSMTIGGSSTTQDLSAVPTSQVENRFAGYYDGTVLASCLNGTCSSTSRSLTLPSGAPTVWIGESNTQATPVYGVVKRVCLDADPARCR